MALDNLFQGLRINNYYKYLLYLFGIIFVGSLFFTVNKIDLQYLRKLSFTIIIFSSSIWFIEGMLDIINKFLYEKSIDEDDREKYKKNIHIIAIIYFVYQIIGWISIFYFLYSL